MAAYVLIALVLCIEACMPSNVSGQHSNSVGNMVNVKVDRDVPLEKIELTADPELPTDVFVGQSITLIPVFTPSSSTYKQIIMDVSDETIATVYGDTVTFNASGIVTVTVTSTHNASITASADFTVYEAVPEKIEINRIDSIKVGDTVYLSATVLPEIATNSDYYFTSASDCVNIEDNAITAISEGTATITAVMTAYPTITDSFEISVTAINATSLGFYLAGNAVSSITLTQYESKDLSVKIEPQDATYQDLVWEAFGVDIYFYSDKDLKITATEVGNAAITATLANDPDIRATLTITVSEPEIVPEFGELTNILCENKTLYIGEKSSLSITPITDGGLAAPQKYEYTIIENAGVISISSFGEINALSLGTAKVRVSAIGKDISAEVEITVIDKLINSLTITQVPTDIKIGKYYALGYSYSPISASAKRAIWSVSDETIAVISKNGMLKFLKAGTVTVTAKAVQGNASDTITLTAKNILSIASIRWIGPSNFVIDDSATATLKKNSSARISVIFGKYATYKKIEISSSDQDVLAVTGMAVTALKTGTATVTITCWDGDEANAPIVYNVEVTVAAQKLSDVMGNWGYAIRKGIGHFGAFLVMGIFAALTYLLFMKNKYLASLITLISGFAIAGLTELLQMLTPGRGPAFSDVILDFTGFCFAVIPIILGFIIAALVKRFKRKPSNDEEETK